MQTVSVGDGRRIVRMYDNLKKGVKLQKGLRLEFLDTWKKEKFIFI